MLSGDEFYDDDVTSGPVEECPICRLVRYGVTVRAEVTACERSSETAPLCEHHRGIRAIQRAVRRGEL